MLPGSQIGPYRVVELIGRGGMGEIYAARDEKLDRLVALKTISPSLLHDDRSRRRLLAEARAAAALDHPFICTVHEVLEDQDRALIVMEYLRGETLADRIGRGALPPSEIRRIAIEITEALDAAHRGGIIHRDLKPANIMLTASGHVKVMDFGLSLIVAGSPEEMTARYSDADLGSIAGTLAYVAPELLSGGTVGVAADLYSLGVVLYEIATGRRPFRGDSTSALIGEILHQQAREPGHLNPELPARFSALVLRMLSKRPEQRPPSAEDVLDELRAIELIGEEKRRSDASRSLAVLPFKQLFPDPENAHLGVGLADATITELALVRSLRVRPTASILRFGDRGVDPIEAGRQLGVDAVVDGSFQRAGTRLRITVQLISIAEGRTLWSTKIDTRMEDIFAVQDEVSRKIVQSLELELTPADEKRKAQVAPPAGDAYDLILRGRACLFRQTPDDVHAAVAYFERARELDPKSPLPLAGLADAYARLAFSFEPDAGWSERARQICDRLLELDPNSPDGHYIRGLLLWRPDGGFQHALAIREFSAAIAARPSLMEAYDWLATVLFHVGMLDEAEIELEHALSIDPESFTTLADGGICSLLQRRYDDALEKSRRIQARVEHGLAHYVDTIVQVHTGNLKEAERHAQEAIRNQITPVRFYPVLGLVEALRGNEQGATEQVERTLYHRMEYGHFHHAQYDIGCIYSILGHTDQALEWVTASALNGFPCYTAFRTDPLLANIQKDPRFLELNAQLETECREYAAIYRNLIL